MTLAHLGLAVFVVGVVIVNAYSIERDVRLEPGEVETLAVEDLAHGERQDCARTALYRRDV